MDLEKHRARGPASGLFYDVAFNVLHWSLREDANVGKNVRLVKLDPAYNIISADAYTMEGAIPASFALPSIPGISFPKGLSLDAASIEPATETLYVYVCTQHDEDQRKQASLFRAALSEDGSNGGRAYELVRVDESTGDGPLMQSIATVESPDCNLPAKFFFTLTGDVFLQNPYYPNTLGVNNVYMGGMCRACPEGLTTEDGMSAQSVEDCRHVICSGS